LTDLKKLLSYTQREYFALYKFHKFIKPFYDPEIKIKGVPYITLIIIASALLFAITNISFGRVEDLILKIFLVLIIIYTLFVFYIYIRHDSLEHEMHQIEALIQDHSEHM